jgi:transcriptional regulator with XRE-family HTH domain
MPPVKKPHHARAKTFMVEWRKHRGLSQEEAAARVDLDRTTLGRIEKGILPYNQDFLEKLSFAYGCEPSDILSVNPLAPAPPRLVWDRLRSASPEVQESAWRIVEALLKTSGEK